MRSEFTVETSAREQFVNITATIDRCIAAAGLAHGMCTVFVPHTTAGLTVNEGADPAVMEDLLHFLDRLVPLKGEYRHAEGNSDAHIKASLLGTSLHLPVRGGRLDLGTWQGVFLGEFDGPRQRRVVVWAGREEAPDRGADAERGVT